MHKAETERAEAKKLVSRQRQLDYSRYGSYKW